MPMKSVFLCAAGGAENQSTDHHSGRVCYTMHKPHYVIGNMEIEAKFRVDDDQTFPDLLGLKALGPFRFTAEPDAEDQRNVYFDTADGRLRAARYGLRVRDLGVRRL